MRHRPSLAVALALSWFGCFLMMFVVAWLDAGRTAWLQGAIYLLAAILLGLGCRGLILGRYLGDRTARRRGVLYLVAASSFASYGFYRVRKHREAVAEEERQLAPVIEAIGHFRQTHGRIPTSVDELTDLPPHLPHFHYEPLGGDAYRVGFKHDVFVHHDYLSSEGGWRDEVSTP